MREQISNLTQSRYFSPVFNGAIFDGPIRIYFSQSQEASAMKLYFAVLARMRSKFGALKDNFSEDELNIFVLVYPTAENFNIVFPGDQRKLIQADRLEDDYVIGVNGPLEETDFDQFFGHLDQILENLPANSSNLAGPDL